jgi:hypothetical protein
LQALHRLIDHHHCTYPPSPITPSPNHNHIVMLDAIAYHHTITEYALTLSLFIGFCFGLWNKSRRNKKTKEKREVKICLILINYYFYCFQNPKLDLFSFFYNIFKENVFFPLSFFFIPFYFLFFKKKFPLFFRV